MTCRARGHEVEFFTIHWEGDEPRGLKVNRLPVKGLFNHTRYRDFARQISALRRSERFDLLVGFNKIPSLDIYFAADGCYLVRAQRRHWVYRQTGRHRCFIEFERAIFEPTGQTRILVLVNKERDKYRAAYGTPEPRFELLPPGIAPDRLAPDNRQEIRSGLRGELGVQPEQQLVLMIGSGFRTKGLDRALRAIADLPAELRSKTRFVVIGRDHAGPYRRLAKRLGVDKQVTIFAGRDDVPRLLQGADLLIHPAYYKNSGMVLLESIVAGLPVLTTDQCGYAEFVRRADAGTAMVGGIDVQRHPKKVKSIIGVQLQSTAFFGHL